jgi:predicted transcriptional regulator
MVNQNNGNGKNGNGSNGNGKERLDFSISSELNERLEAFAVAEDRSVQSVLRDSVERYLDKSDVREVIRSACEKGKLREESSVCKNIDRD